MVRLYEQRYSRKLCMRSSFLKKICCNLAAIHFYRPIQLQFKHSIREQPDIHARLMSHYPQGKWLDWMLSDWYWRHYMIPSSWVLLCVYFWYGHSSIQTNMTYWWLLLIVISFIFASVCIQLWPTGMTIWALVIALLIGELSPQKSIAILILTFEKHLSLWYQSVWFKLLRIDKLDSSKRFSWLKWYHWMLKSNSVISELIVGFMIPGTLTLSTCRKRYDWHSGQENQLQWWCMLPLFLYDEI